jgi:hypothetical protein
MRTSLASSIDSLLSLAARSGNPASAAASAPSVKRRNASLKRRWIQASLVTASLLGIASPVWADETGAAASGGDPAASLAVPGGCICVTWPCPCNPGNPGPVLPPPVLAQAQFCGLGGQACSIDSDCGSGVCEEGCCSSASTTPAATAAAAAPIKLPGGCICVTEPCPCDGVPNVGTLHNEGLAYMAQAVGPTKAGPISPDVYQRMLKAEKDFVVSRTGASPDEVDAVIAAFDGMLHDVGAFDDNGYVTMDQNTAELLVDYAHATGAMSDALYKSITPMWASPDTETAFKYMTGAFAQAPWAGADRAAADGMISIGSASHDFGAALPEWNWEVDSAGGVVGTLIEPGLGTLCCGLSASFGYWLGSLDVVANPGGGGSDPNATNTGADPGATAASFSIPGGCLCVTDPCPCGGPPNIGTFHNEMLTYLAKEIGMDLAYTHITADVYASALAAAIDYAQMRLGLSAQEAQTIFAGVDADLHNLGAFNADGSLRPWTEYRAGAADYALAQGRITPQLHAAMVKMASFGDDDQAAYAYLTGEFAQTPWASESDAFRARAGVEVGIDSAALWFGLAASIKDGDPGRAKELPHWFGADVFGAEVCIEGGPAGAFLGGAFFSMMAAGNI